MRLTILITLLLSVACQTRHEQAASTTASSDTSVSSTAAAQPAPVAASESGGVQTVDLKITPSGYSPASITVREGLPVRLNVTREDSSACGETIVIPAQNISRTIAVGKTETIEFTPKAAGDLEFTCGMNMMRGRIVVQKG